MCKLLLSLVVLVYQHHHLGSQKGSSGQNFQEIRTQTRPVRPFKLANLDPINQEPKQPSPLLACRICGSGAPVCQAAEPTPAYYTFGLVCAPMCLTMDSAIAGASSY